MTPAIEPNNSKTWKNEKVNSGTEEWCREMGGIGSKSRSRKWSRRKSRTTEESCSRRKKEKYKTEPRWPSHLDTSSRRPVLQPPYVWSGGKASERWKLFWRSLVAQQEEITLWKKPYIVVKGSRQGKSVRGSRQGRFVREYPMKRGNMGVVCRFLPQSARGQLYAIPSKSRSTRNDTMGVNS